MFSIGFIQSWQFFAYCIVIFGLTLASLYGVLTGNRKPAVLSAFAIVMIGIMVVQGHDYRHHVARIITLANQARSGSFGLLFDNYFHGESLPIFLYYSVIPYIPGLLLCLLGIPAALAYKISLVIYLGIFIAGILRLIKYQEVADKDSALIGLLLLMGANYVIGLWLVRSAMAEILSFSLVPWITSFLIQKSSSRLALFLLLALQASIHPIVMIHSLLAEIGAAWGLSRKSFLELFKLNWHTLLASLAVSSPFWLPAVIYRDAILGPKALPVAFENTFLTVNQLIHPLSWLSPGIPFLLVSIWMLINSRNKHQVAMLGLFFISLFSQTIYGRFVVAKLPLLDVSIFIWRMLFVTSFWGFSLYIIGSRSMPLIFKRLLICTAVITMAAFSAKSYRPSGLMQNINNDAEFNSYYQNNRTWGIAEYFPDYSSLSDKCLDIAGQNNKILEFASLSKSPIILDPSADRIFASIRRGPWKFVAYRFNGIEISPVGHCGEDLILGPFLKPGILESDYRRLSIIIWSRMLSVVLMATALIMTLKNFVASRASMPRKSN
jgi:hypothetical protein